MGDESVAIEAKSVRIGHAAAFLDADKPLRREPRAPNRKRSDKFWSQFEDRALFYDCFWHENGRDIILVGPPPRNLLPVLQSADIRALPSGEKISLTFNVARSTLVCVGSNVPADTLEIELSFDGQRHVLPVQPNHCDVFAGKRLLFTMNKDNDLDWIAAWARWYATMHGTNAIVIFDNGSTRYSLSDLENVLAGIEGIDLVCVIDWPYRYGPHDPAVVFHRYWANFLQVSSYTMLFRRMARRCEAILNCDIDELIGNEGGKDAYQRAVASPDGIVTCKGTWVECVVDAADADQPNHFAYRYRDKNPLRAVCANKWALDPSRAWCDDMQVMPSVHRIYGVPKSTGRKAPKLPFWHFKAINTNWKTDRRQALNFDPARHRRLEALDAEIARFFSRTDQA